MRRHRQTFLSSAQRQDDSQYAWTEMQYIPLKLKKIPFFTLHVNEHCVRFLRDFVKSSFLGIFKIWLDKTLNNLQVILLWGRYDSMISRSPFQTHWFCDSSTGIVSRIQIQKSTQDLEGRTNICESRLNTVMWSCVRHISCDHRVGLVYVPCLLHTLSVYSSLRSWEELACRCVS